MTIVCLSKKIVAVAGNRNADTGSNPLRNASTSGLFDALSDNKLLTFAAMGRGDRARDENAALELAHRATHDDAIVEKMIQIVLEGSGKIQKLAVWVLMHSTENPKARDFVVSNFHGCVIPYRSLDGKEVRDKHGRRYILRIKEYPARQVLVAVDLPEGDWAGAQNWNLGGVSVSAGTVELHFGDMVANQRTVSYILYMYGMPKQFISSEKMSMPQIREWLTVCTAFATETTPYFGGRGVYKAAMRAWISILPKGTWVMIPLTESRTVLQLSRGKDFFETPVGRPYKDQGFGVADISPTVSPTTGLQFSILLRKVA